jgi:hypothetical protein
MYYFFEIDITVGSFYLKNGIIPKISAAKRII